MNIINVMNRRHPRFPTPGAVGIGRTLALLLPMLALLPLPANSGDKSADKLSEAWPTTAQVRYRLRYNSFDVGRLDVGSSTTAKTYSVSGSGKVSVFLGTFKWWGGSSVSGTIENGDPVPATYAFEWHHNKGKKNVTIHIGYKDRAATDVAVEPQPRVRPDTVPLTQAHKAGALDPLSAILMLTKVDNRPPCDRRVGVFDGTQRYDIVFTPKRETRLPPLSGGGSPELAHVCRITYEPVAGHRANADTNAYASNRDVEVMLRRIPGSGILFPYSVTIPTDWGTGTMVAERIEIVTAGGKFAFTN